MVIPHDCPEANESTLVLRLTRSASHDTRVHWYCPVCWATGNGVYQADRYVPTTADEPVAPFFPPYDH